MGFAIECARRAEDDLDRLPPGLLQAAIDAVYRLADDPVRLSRPPDYGQTFQRYISTLRVDDEEVLLTVIFQYTQDEMAIEIAGVYVNSP